MMQEAIDFREECDALCKLLEPLNDADFDRVTQFKDWTVNDVMQHLHFFNYAADLSLEDAEVFKKVYGELKALTGAGDSLVSATDKMLKGVKGRALFDLWKDYYPRMAANFEKANPDLRVPWAGPDMSARMAVTARQMETWSHGQEIYDLLGAECPHGDRVKNIALLGVMTFKWTFVNRGEDVPAEKPHVRLTGPSGAVFEYNDPSETNLIEGDAVEFCKVVTQGRSIGDTSLQLTGAAAKRWMEIAQCFAGDPRDPPAAGTRFKL